MTNLSDLFPAGAGKQVSFVASGTLASGQTVALKTDGTVEAITGVAEGTGTPSVFEAASSTYMSSTFDSDSNKVVIAYKDEGNSNYGTAIVGTVSGTSISFGTAVVFQSLITDEISAVYDSTNGKVVVSYREAASSLSGRAIVGTVSGTSISFGTETVFESGDTTYTSAVYDSTNGKVVIAYSDGGNGQYGTAIVGTVSGTSISFGTAAVFESADSNYISAAYDSTNNKVVISYQDDANSTFGTAVVGTVSGTSISFGTPVVFNAAGAFFVSSSFDANANKVVISYRDSGNANYGTSIVGTVSGTSISFGTSVVFENAITNYISSTFDSNLNKVVIAYSDSGNSSHGTSVVGTVSGTSISFGAAAVFENAASTYISATYDSTNNKVVIAYQDSGNSGYGTGIVSTVGSTNNTSFIGIADAAISSAASGNVTIKGGIAVNGLSSLTPGSDYYVQNDGSLAAGVTSIPYDISGATFVDAFSVSSQESDPRGIAFNTDGTKMFIVGSGGDEVNQYALSTGFDVSTASFTQTFSVAAQEIIPEAIAFNTDGTKMFITGLNGDDVNEYALSTGFDVSTASFTDAFSVAGQETAPTGLSFNTDGTKMFIVGEVGVDVNEYALTTGFDVSTASFTDSFSIASQEAAPQGLAFSTDGTKMFVVGDAGNDVNEYTLSTGFDVSTASFTTLFSVAGQDTSPRGLTFNNNGTKMFVVGGAGVDVNEYAVTQTTFVTTVKAGRAMSATSINLEYQS